MVGAAGNRISDRTEFKNLSGTQNSGREAAGRDIVPLNADE